MATFDDSPLPAVVTLRGAVDAFAGTCGAAYIDVAGDLKVHGNTNALELADLFERAAGMLRKEADPEAMQLGETD